ncbi:synaptogenesis protein syg-2-like [Palaemon carinicauda]|uniref:synaptogenesis protein syg-2-like n=1 Tax=Palaemon carinicauda TaxID=392227 RepID=UPI0035B636CB
MNKPGSDVWMLRIRYPQMRDAGKYECQVSMRPPIARVIELNVVEPQAIIPSAPELYVDHGSPLNITCVVPDSPEPPENIFWYHRDKMVSYDGSRQGVTITTDKGPTTTSVLFIPDATSHDSGIYVCAPQGMKEASVRVRVLNGELPQAMQTGSTCRCCAGSSLLLLPMVFYHMMVITRFSVNL